MDVAQLRIEIQQQQATMVAVATGGPRIDDENYGYQNRRRVIAIELRRLGLDDPNPHHDLWSWYGHWTAQGMETYQSRRDYVRELYAPLLDALDHLEQRQLGAELQPPQTGWEAVDHQLAQLRERYAVARTADDHKAIGLLCREIFRSLADATFSERDHLPHGQKLPSPADAVARLEHVVDALAAGGRNREIRKVIKANFDLANKVQHAQHATLNHAALIAEATIASVNLLRILVLGAGEVAGEPEGAEEAEEEPRGPDYGDEDWFRDR